MMLAALLLAPAALNLLLDGSHAGGWVAPAPLARHCAVSPFAAIVKSWITAMRTVRKKECEHVHKQSFPYIPYL